MNRVTTNAISTTVAVTGLVVLSAAPAVAAEPHIERASCVDRYEDDYILDLCGIETWTTVTERWSSTNFPDGSEIFHVVRTYVPDDPRLPVEKGAATSFFAVDGSRNTVGAPLHLFDPDGGGTLLMGAGRALFDTDGNLVSATGQRAALDADLAEYYCPS